MGGMEQASANLANALQSLNVNVTYVSLFKQEIFFQLNSAIKFYEPESFNIQKLNLFKSLRWIRNIINNENPEAIIVYNKLYSAIVQLALLGNKKNVFISERSSPTFKWNLTNAAFNKIVFSVTKPKGIIAQTKIAADYQKKYYGKKIPIKVINNVLREVKLYPDINRQNTILAVGRLNDNLKGFDMLVDAFAKLKNKTWILVFAGGDEEGNLLKEQAKFYKISERIKFLGKVKDIDKIYADAGIFVIPSRSEGFPNALCEAMAAGLPCISFDFIAGPREIISDGYDGLIVENGNIKALTETIDYLIENPLKRQRIGQNAMEIRERLKPERIGQEYLNFILSNGIE
jgi:glycosyltransferase involved in cell wall biosynthesis